MPDWIYPNQNYSYDPYRDRLTPGPTPPFPQNPFPAFPFPIAPYANYDSRESYEQDMRYLVSLYPDFIRPMLEQVRIAADRYDYPGGFLSDRYPDKERILRIVAEIYDALADSMENASWDGMADPMHSLAGTNTTYMRGNAENGYAAQPANSGYPQAPGNLASPAQTGADNSQYGGWPDIRFTKNPRNPWLMSLVQILFSNEILYRRQNNQNQRRYWFGY